MSKTTILFTRIAHSVALNDASQIAFQLKCRPAWWKAGAAKLAATATYPLGELLEMHVGDGGIVLPLCPDSGAGATLGTLTVRVRAFSSLEATKLSLDSAREFHRRSKTLSAKHAARYKAGYEVLKPICAILDIVGPLIAFSPEPICAAVIGVVRGAAKVKGLQQRLAKADTDLNSSLILHTAIAHGNVAHNVGELHVGSALSRLHPLPMYTARRPRCEDGEHTATRAHIAAWATAPTAQNVLWLRGPAEAAVATTLFHEFFLAEQLCAHFFFERPLDCGRFAPTTTQREQDPAFIFQTLAAQLGGPLAKRSARPCARTRSSRPGRRRCSARSCLWRRCALRRPRGRCCSSWTGCTGAGRPLGGDGARSGRCCSGLLRLLVEGSGDFPANVRLLLCSRESASVREVVRGCERVTEYEMEAGPAEACRDWSQR
ncbi:hypothetical protein B0H17DRAFT_459354 [Mycena rosella]|uniref:Uncharacterized protein n=1 Tax=Mycena rosella TaxID=1033263 RepID=A0AAD7C9Q3_MYCRO|nr:hypothetical protein B0H17DRAFT_459354 [Mycena rosella]